MKPFIPDKLPLKNLEWESLIKLIVTANREIVRCDNVLGSIPNPLLLLNLMGNQEAVMSSRIEGTQATLEEVLKFDEKKEKKQSVKSLDIKEVINYIKAVSYGSEYIKNKPIHLNFVREMHTILMSGVRGENKAAGEFRKAQNWIGKPGCSIDTANYFAPSPMVLNEYLYNWENYIHYDEKDRLVQLAIIHAQFEIIHPFLDGNGRIGRALTPLFLYEKKLLRLPVFYMSGYLEKNRKEYYKRLQNISENNDWNGWIVFFSKGNYSSML